MSRIIAFSVIFIAAVLVGYFIIVSRYEPLPVYAPRDINPRLVDSSLQSAEQEHYVASFRLVNQLGDTVTEKELGNKVYVADFFFTRCLTICPVMSANMKKVQEALRDIPDFMILSHSVTPEADSASVLKEYGERYDTDPARWWLLSGNKKHIYDLARKSYFAVLDEGDGGMQDFIHTENFVLVDKEKRLRGFYDGTREKEVQRLIDDVRRLMKEYENE
jgi:protein SCO1/2